MRPFSISLSALRSSRRGWLRGILGGGLLLPGRGAERKKNAAEAGTTVRFVAQNVHNYRLQPFEEGSRITPAKTEREIQALVRLLAGLRPDVLGLVEMGGKDDLMDLQQRLEKAGLEMPHSEWVDGNDPVRHVALLSRFPITNRNPVTNLTYRIDQEELPVQRGFLDVTVAVTPHFPLRLLGAHLKSQRETPEADQALMRRNEAHLLRKHADVLLTEDPATRLLVFGDFNESKDSPGVREIQGISGTPLALRDLTLEDSRGERWTYYYEPSDEYSRIDFLFSSQAMKEHLRLNESFVADPADWQEASDHRALVLTFSPR